MPTISVVIPAYNQAAYLGAAIRSVLGQTRQDFEIIVVDDGSTDGTSEVAASFADARVRCIRQDNRGLPAARNTGIRAATGACVSLLDSDDLFLPRKLELLADALDRQPGLGLVAGKAAYIDQDGCDLQQPIGSALPDDPAQLLLGNPIHVGSVLVRRAWLERVGLFDERLRACEDWDMWLRLATAGCPMRSIDQPVSLYRVHTAQMTRSAKRMREAMLQTLDKTFAAPDLPESWRAWRSQAYAAAYVKAGGRALLASEFADAANDLDQAARLDPGLAERDGQRLAALLSNWSDDPAAGDALDYLQRAYGHLPPSLEGLRRRGPRELARKAKQMAFDAYRRGEVRRARALFWRAFIYQPVSLKDRGTLTICARSLLGRV
jgi:glycosyltransferase involved in cell wall biosynthesis